MALVTPTSNPTIGTTMEGSCVATPKAAPTNFSARRCTSLDHFRSLSRAVERSCTTMTSPKQHGMQGVRGSNPRTSANLAPYFTWLFKFWDIRINETLTSEKSPIVRIQHRSPHCLIRHSESNVFGPSTPTISMSLDEVDREALCLVTFRAKEPSSARVGERE